MIRTLTALAIILTCNPAPLADTHYVSKTGSNTPPYTSWANAADTVARAVEAASEWDTILIAAGHYVTDTIMMKREQILMGSGMDSTMLDTLPNVPQHVILSADSCEISGFTLVGDVKVGLSATSPTDGMFFTGTGVYILEDRATTVRGVRFQNLSLGVAMFRTNASFTGPDLTLPKLLSGFVFRSSGTMPESAKLDRKRLVMTKSPSSFDSH